MEDRRPKFKPLQQPITLVQRRRHRPRQLLGLQDHRRVDARGLERGPEHGQDTGSNHDERHREWDEHAGRIDPGDELARQR